MIIRRLIIYEWLKFFFTAFLVLLTLLSVGNLISGFMRGNVTATEVLLSYIIQLPAFVNQILPVSSLVASLFSINKMKNRNELTAIFASGYSRQSFLQDLILVSSFVAFFQFITSAYINPLVKSKRFEILDESLNKFRNLKSQGLSSSTIGTGEIWYKSNGYFFSFSHFDSKLNRLNNINIYNYDVDYKLKKIANIKSMIYNEEHKTWNPDIVNEIEGLNTKSFPVISQFSSPIILTEQIEDFKQIESDITTLSFLRLYEYISQLRKSGINVGEYLVAFYRHISDSLICIIFALLAAIPIFNPNRRNSSFGGSASLVFVFTLMYWLIQTYFLELGRSLTLSPFVSCFTVPILFVFIIIFVFYKNRKLA